MPNFLGSNFYVVLSKKASATLLKKIRLLWCQHQLSAFLWFGILSRISFQPPASVIFPISIFACLIWFNTQPDPVDENCSFLFSISLRH